MSVPEELNRERRFAIESHFIYTSKYSNWSIPATYPTSLEAFFILNPIDELFHVNETNISGYITTYAALKKQMALETLILHGLSIILLLAYIIFQLSLRQTIKTPSYIPLTLIFAITSLLNSIITLTSSILNPLLNELSSKGFEYIGMWFWMARVIGVAPAIWATLMEVSDETNHVKKSRVVQIWMSVISIGIAICAGIIYWIPGIDQYTPFIIFESISIINFILLLPLSYVIYKHLTKELKWIQIKLVLELSVVVMVIRIATEAVRIRRIRDFWEHLSLVLVILLMFGSAISIRKMPKG